MLSCKVPVSWLSVVILATAVAIADANANANANSYANSRAHCQSSTAEPLEGCAAGTILVSPTHKDAQFQTIQSAVLSLDETTPATILVLSGTYIEQINVTRSGPLTLLGEVAEGGGGGGGGGKNSVTVQFSAANVNVSYTDNAFTSVLTVAPTLEASLTGSGPTGYPVPAGTPFGNKDFRVYNVDFRNVFAAASVGPSLAVSVSYANAGFYHAGFYSWQDTVYIGKLGNAYFYDNTIAGQTDFFYGFGTAFIQNSSIAMRGCGGGVTAWKGTNTTTFSNRYGVYIADSTLAQENSTLVASLAGQCFLGRPWNSQHRSVFMKTYMDASINSAGYKAWAVSNDPAVSRVVPNVTIMAEYESYGPGWNSTGRIAGNVTTVYTKEDQVNKYASPLAVFMSETGNQPYVSWIDEQFL
ncbi:carbohydrate esterase family 8 protein [Pleomassaria siparia CBS 279.74]|uniref:pectinesterase n=1 Tax=Pleomassaria siparia CBS 279.74 TaxID=1314801 RepID=A0A6G1JRG7_9PLEO|nr:carbohydrate esterase family 8 protein [Pleomassaria siparia CBS 279.74]